MALVGGGLTIERQDLGTAPRGIVASQLAGQTFLRPGSCSLRATTSTLGTGDKGSKIDEHS